MIHFLSQCMIYIKLCLCPSIFFHDVYHGHVHGLYLIAKIALKTELFSQSLLIINEEHSTTSFVCPHLCPCSFGLDIILLKFKTRVEGWRIEVPFTFKTSTFSYLFLFSHDLGRCNACVRSCLYCCGWLSYHDERSRRMLFINY
jgi:hypothetical protein